MVNTGKKERTQPASLKPLEVAVYLLIRCILIFYTYISWPFYFLIQKPWKVVASHKRPRAMTVMQSDDFIQYRTTEEIKDIHARYVQDKIDTMEKIFRLATEQHGDKPALGTREILAEEDERQPSGQVFKKLVLGEYQWRSFSRVGQEAEAFGRGLRELGLKARDNVVIFAETRAEWFIAANGCMKQNMPLVTLYATLGQDALIHGINETEVTCVITSHELLPKFKTLLPFTPKVSMLIAFEDQLKPLDTTGYGDQVKILPYKEVIRSGETSNKTDAMLPTAQDTAIIMYTSGSTGVPKGVMLSHLNIVNAVYAMTDRVQIYEDDVYMAYLPLAHVYEFIAENWLCMMCGVPIGYSSPHTLTDKSTKIKNGGKGDASVLRPTILLSVPLVLDRIYKNVQEKIESGPAITRAIFNIALEYKLHWSHKGYDTPIINAVLFKPVRALLGGRVRIITSGGAPLAPETHRTLRAIFCVPVLQGYGLTETTAAGSVTDMEDISAGMAGGPLTVGEIKLVNWEEGNYRVTDWPNPRGEIHIGGIIVSKGYYKQPEKTKVEFYEENGVRWFRTGDIGEMSSIGVMHIIDRKKDLVKLQYGEYVSLGKVEAELKSCSLVDNVCVYADPSKMFPVALLMPNPDQLKAIAQQNGVGGNFEELCTNPLIEKLVLAEIQKHSTKSRRLEKMEIPQAVKLVPDVWTPDSGFVTAALKLKRKNIQDHYQFLIDRMYGACRQGSNSSL